MALKRITGAVRQKSGPRRLPSPKRVGYTGTLVELATKGSESKQLTDPFANQYGIGLRGAIEPVYSFMRLAVLPQQTNILRQCVESYTFNIESNGYVLDYVGPEGGEAGPEQQKEKQKLTSFLEFVSPDTTLTELRERCRWDLEIIGNRFIEVIRSAGGQIISLNHIPGVTMRVTKRDLHPVEVEVQIPDPEMPGEFITTTCLKYFRRYVQIGYSGKRVFFKEMGDPRSISPTTGDEDDTLAIEEQATEVHWQFLYQPGSVYGLPRYIGQIPSLLGSRESEMVNLNFFRDNAVPAMTVLVSGGALTEDSFARIEDYINAVKGRDAMQRVMVLEAAADDSAGGIDHSQPAPKIEMKPMQGERQQDGLFSQYDQDCQQKVRQSYRLPPIYIGRAEDYTRASAVASMLTAESQIFAPERMKFDEFMNKFILGTYKPKFWRFKTLAPAMNDPQSITQLIGAFGKEGALTPNAVIKIANKVLDADIQPIPDDWGNVPFAVVLQYIAGGNQIKGLDDFVEQMESIAPPGSGGTGAPIASEDDGADNPAGKLKKMVTAEIIALTKDIRENTVKIVQPASTQASVQPIARPGRVLRRIAA